jgi:hypothetical protein
MCHPFPTHLQKAYKLCQAIYMLVQVARTSPSKSWWVAVAGYSTCTFLWLFGVVVVQELIRSFLRLWNQGMFCPLARL